MPACNKLVIAGTGRAGTTFLVQLLTELGLDTGFTEENSRDHYHEHCQAGLERDLSDPHSPRVIKNPALTLTLPVLWREGHAPPIEHVFVPVRDLRSAALSRVRVGGDGREAPGGLWLTSEPERQADALAVVFHEFLHALAKYDIPFTLLAFPRFATDPEYCFSKLRFLLPACSQENFVAAFQRTVRPELIHVFEGNTPSADPAIIAAYKTELAERRSRRRKRRLHRVISVLISAFILVVLYIETRKL